jgi:hypothetical protein
MRVPFVSVVIFALAPCFSWGDESSKPGAKTFQVPYRLTSTNHVLVRVRINGKGPFNFILDTGAPTLFVGTAVGRKLAVRANAQGEAAFDRFEVEGGVVIEKAKGRIEDPFQLEGMNGLGLAGVELHGMIGYTILARYRLEFDFTKHKMGWTPLDYQPPAPHGLGGQGAPAGMEAIGSIMKLLGSMLGKKPRPGIVLRGFLGIALADSDDSVVVQAVLPGSPAAGAGLVVGDKISRFQGTAIRSWTDLHRLAAKLAPDEPVRLTVTHGSEGRSVELKAGRGL